MDIIEISGRSPLTPCDGFSRRTNRELDNHASCGVTPLYQAHTGGPAGPSPSGRAARWLDRTLRIVDEGFAALSTGATVVSLASTSVLALAVAAFIRPHGSLPGTQRQMIASALARFCLSAVLLLASLAAGRSRPGSRLDRVVAPRERAAIWLALAAWFPFPLIVVYYRAKATFPPPVRYVYFPYDDKRWETAAYLLGVLAPIIWLTTAARVLAVGRGKPPTWRAWFTGLFPGSRR